MKDIERLAKINTELQEQKNIWEDDILEWNDIYNRTGSSSAYGCLETSKKALKSLQSVAGILNQ